VDRAEGRKKPDQLPVPGGGAVEPSLDDGASAIVAEVAERRHRAEPEPPKKNGSDNGS
jgi:hypothetical protein